MKIYVACLKLIKYLIEEKYIFHKRHTKSVVVGKALLMRFVNVLRAYVHVGMRQTDSI